MKVFPQSISLTLVAVIALAGASCKEKPSKRPATVSTVEKIKHTKTKAHKRDKKKEKEKSGGEKKAAKPTPAKSS